ncbi:nitrogen assimilation regulatory protein NtrX [Treponema primitia ZAS-2]|uniref:Nitrogen assimilation regulatory protein NtrX n=1 Tax=Treponema primitia (strain ATCC BAA-887 / DSM 12427 / ZAS-2) TaxID=545694 RepID=F5YK04_TREPZ|nr:sigma-54 dependent transcriptional regulator [Treponema primitia]AEF84031.1 nitrogen assimilation regulatory protein NtrX [Treponema primitia ZAS-2]
MTKILIIDDEPGIRKTLASILEDEHYLVHTSEDAIMGMDFLEQEPVNLIFLDVLLPRLGGLEALDRIHKKWPGIEVVIISGHANVDMAVRAVKLGAFDFLEKPLSLDKVLTVCRNALALQKLREENTDLRKNILNSDDIIGASEPIARVRELIKQAAISDARILITGENGTGKELVARAVHRLSSRAGKAFVEVNCAAIPETLIESELFGHEKGAFTDAVASRKGRFELAYQGTLFLDEIGDMSLAAQAKVLRVIQEQKLERVGGEKTIDTDVRILAATNKNLEEECARGRFRQDLFFRLNVIPINMPPLRERPGDILLLLRHFLGELGVEWPEMEDGARDMLLAHPWPGNVRELKNLAERIAVLCNGEKIKTGVLQDMLKKNPGAEKNPEKSGGDTLQNQLPLDIFKLDYTEAKEVFEKNYLEYQLAQNGGIISRTAEAIGVYPSNLHAKIRKYGLRTER